MIFFFICFAVKLPPCIASPKYNTSIFIRTKIFFQKDVRSGRFCRDRFREARQAFESATGLFRVNDPRRRVSVEHARAAERKSNYHQSQEVKQFANRTNRFQHRSEQDDLSKMVVPEFPYDIYEFDNEIGWVVYLHLEPNARRFWPQQF